MQITSAEFLMSAPDYDGCPNSTLPEFAFIGRSNVGKSSLINQLTRRKDLARVSSKPGATRAINFFTINNKWSLVDLPGYGYAKVDKASRERFQDFIEHYLSQRENLRCVFVLINSHHPPQESDLNFCAWLASAEIPFVLVFTKTDKLKKAKRYATSEAFLNALSNYVEGTPRTFFNSIKEEQGRKDILNFLQQALS